MLNLTSEARIEMKSNMNVNNNKDSYKKEYIKNKYFITIRKHRTTDYVTVEQIGEVITVLCNNLKSLNLLHYTYEVDKKYNQLHLHAIVNIDQYFKYNKLLSIKGFRIYWKQIYDISRLISYLTKQSQTAEELESLLIINKYTHKKSPNYFI